MRFCPATASSGNTMETLADLFEDTLRDIYYAEKHILKALPKMGKKAGSENLAAAFEKHKGETEKQVARLEKVFKLIDKAPRGKKCDAIEGILAEAEELMKEAKTDTVRDAAMVGAAQAVEHYEISRYGTLIAWATKLGMDDATRILAETLEEEKATDKALSELAESEINLEADDQAEEHEGAMKPKKRAASR
jgi:ferritin-like metal-binding protein YciE